MFGVSRALIIVKCTNHLAIQHKTCNAMTTCDILLFYSDNSILGLRYFSVENLLYHEQIQTSINSPTYRFKYTVIRT